MAAPAVAFTQVDSLWLSVGLLLPAMFFASFPMPTSTAAMQILPPTSAQVSALFLLISNLIGLGLGTTAVALLTDRWFRDPAAVGQSLSALIGAAAVACVVLLAAAAATAAAAGRRPARSRRPMARRRWAAGPRPRSGHGLGRRGATIRRGSGDATARRRVRLRR